MSADDIGGAAGNYAAEEPLLERDEDADDEDEELDVRHDDSEANGWFIWLLTLAAGVSGLLFGYDTGVISSTLVSIKSDLQHPLSTLDKSLITSATSLFALIASPLAGVLADVIGRRMVILNSCILFIVGALIQAFATNVAIMIIGRAVVGLAVGTASFVVPLYISELAPSAARGRLVTINQLLITGGQVVAYLVGWAFSDVPAGWRWMVGLGGLPAAIQLLMLGWMPETPRWLVRAERTEDARSVLLRVYGRGGDAQRIVRDLLVRVKQEIEDEERSLEYRSEPERQKNKIFAKLGKLGEAMDELFAVGGNRRALAIACLLQGLQQLCGFNSLMYFSATIFSMLGFRSPILTSLSVAGTNFIFTLVVFHLIDRLGRRRILLASIPVMIAGLVLCSVAFRNIHLQTDSMVEIPEESTIQPWAVVILVAMVTYVAGYAVGLGCVPWQQSELFPLSVRSVGSALATATNWASNTVTGFTFLPLMQQLTPPGTFALYAAICAVGWVAIWALYPETAGLGLEEVKGLLKDGWGVKESIHGFKQRKRAAEDSR